MHPSQVEIEQFYKLWYSLIWNINKKHKIVPSFKKPVYGEKVNEEPFIAIRAELWEKPQWIDDYLRDNELDVLTENDCEIIKS